MLGEWHENEKRTTDSESQLRGLGFTVSALREVRCGFRVGEPNPKAPLPGPQKYGAARLAGRHQQITVVPRRARCVLIARSRLPLTR